ncbi:MAG: methyltransferase domain-containing protein [Oligoflexia bacterium]|nr:methyltransferase domain-containing protein [Oligoflexia bacterium]
MKIIPVIGTSSILPQQKVQNVFLRSYCSEKGYEFKLSHTLFNEGKIDQQKISEFKKSHILLYSFELFVNLGDAQILIDNGNIIEGAVEGIVVKNSEDIQELQLKLEIQNSNNVILGEEVDFTTDLHSKAKRDYVARVTNFPKGECATIAKQFGEDYWDGDRKYGYGGYRYDGRWKVVAQRMISKYSLKDGDTILDVGCGKGYLLYEFKKLLPNSKVFGVDISKYAIENAHEEIKDCLRLGNATNLTFERDSIDLVISNTTLHNLKINELEMAISEIQRVSRGNSWICVESYRNENEKANLLYWQLTCESFYSPEEWKYLYTKQGYTGDYQFIYFE